MTELVIFLVLVTLAVCAVVIPLTVFGVKAKAKVDEKREKLRKQRAQQEAVNAISRDERKIINTLNLAEQKERYDKLQKDLEDLGDEEEEVSDDQLSAKEELEMRIDITKMSIWNVEEAIRQKELAKKRAAEQAEAHRIKMQKAQELAEEHRRLAKERAKDFLKQSQERQKKNRGREFVTATSTLPNFEDLSVTLDKVLGKASRQLDDGWVELDKHYLELEKRFEQINRSHRKFL